MLTSFRFTEAVAWVARTANLGRRLRFGLLALLTGVALSGAAMAQSYPNKPLWIVVPYAPGGAVDIVARALAAQLSQQLGQPVQVENKTGAGGNIGSAYVAKAAPDGYTLLMGGGATTVAKQLFASLAYDPDKDLTPVAMIGAAPSVLLVSPKLGVKDVRGLIELARSKPGALSFGHGGRGTTSEHLVSEIFKDKAGLEMISVAYKGVTPALTDLMGGQITAVFTNSVNAVPPVKSGKLKALAVASRERLPSLPDVPTMAEAGISDLEVAVWWGLLAPAGVPQEVVDRLNREVAKAAFSDAVSKRLEALGARPMALNPQEFQAFFSEEGRKWAAAAHQAGLKPE